MKRAILVGLATLVVCWATAAAAEVDLGLPSQPKHEVLSGRGAQLYAPPGAGPFPAVVLSHSCAGLSPNVFQWAGRFLAAGYAVLVIDHLGPRGRTSNCYPDIRVSVTEYAQDAVAGLRHLRALPFVDGNRIVQMGFSFGAMAGLRAASESFRRKYLGGERFAAIVSLYPWCNDRAGPGNQDHQWNFYDDTTTPLLVLLGANDDEANPRSCVDKAKANAAKGMPVEYTVFPGTTHAFDNALMGDRPYVIQRGGTTITYRYNPGSVEAAWKLTLDFLGRYAGGSARR
jgi:dienelactone hydrolase